MPATVSVDRTGEFRFAGLRAGSYRLSAGATQTYPVEEFSTAIEVETGQEKEIEFQLKRTVVVESAPPPPPPPPPVEKPKSPAAPIRVGGRVR
jgi:hypothetical protein